MLGLSTVQIVVLAIGALATVLVLVLPRLKLPAIPWPKKADGLTFVQRVAHFDSLYQDLLNRGEVSAAQALREIVLPALLDKRGEQR